MVRCTILVPAPFPFGTIDVPRVSTWRTGEDLLSHSTLVFPHDKLKSKKIVIYFLGLSDELGGAFQK